MSGFDLLQLRWAPHVLLTMKRGPLRFIRIMEAIPGISDRMLTQRLRDLEVAGLVARNVDGGPPIKVAYGLTAAGRAFIEPLEQLQAVESPKEVAAAV